MFPLRARSNGPVAPGTADKVVVRSDHRLPGHEGGFERAALGWDSLAHAFEAELQAD
jgi:hypothetical protein